jgi:oxygen-independent coproporphyrinogen-3 oxidase
VSAIGKVGPTYAQNVKTLDEYYDILDTGRLPVLRGIELTADDLLRRAIIQALMCHFELSIESIEIAHLIDFKQYFAAELADLREMEKGGLLTIDDQWISVCPPAACWCGRSRWSSTATCGPTASAPATPR